mgnify:CR=1 FL=1
MSHGRGHRRLLLVVACLLSVIGTASAHGGTAGSGISVSLVVGLSALVGTATGLGAVVVGSRRVVAVLTHRRFTAVLGVGLTVLGLSFVAPVAGETPAFALLGAGAGIVLARRVPHSHAPTATDGHDVLVAGVVGAIGLHRLFEGVVLAAGFLAGSTVGLMTAVVITLHAAAETVLLATLVTLDGRTRLAVLAVLAVQTGFVLGALTATAATVTVPVTLRYVVVTVAAGVLVYFGLHECKQCYVDWRRTA